MEGMKKREEEAGGMDVGTDGWTGVCKQFGMATLDEALSETE